MNRNKLLKLSLLFLLLTFASCKSNRDQCIDDMMKEEGYDYESACEACDEAANDNMRYEK
jgi:hypothetical protein